MPRSKQQSISHKARRLVERSIQLHVEKATTIHQHFDERDALAQRARESKDALIAYITKIEQQLVENKAMRKELEYYLRATDSVTT